MNKKIIFTALFALVAITGQAKTYKRIIAPNAMACVNVRYPGELRAREVVMTDTATTVHFTMEYPKGLTFQFVKESYLVDEAGNRYPLRSAEGIALNTWVASPENGQTDFTMHFEPLPKRTKIFDFIEGDVPRAFMLLGIHDKKAKLKIPTLQELSKENPYTVPADWFKTDTITVKGRIEGYDAEQFGFTSMECYYEDVFEKDGGALVLDIAPDGSFEKKFQTSYPVHNSFYVTESRNGFSEIPFFARPGETIDITVRKNANGNYECFYNNGSSKEVERWLKADLLTRELTSPLGRFEGNFHEVNQKAEEVWQNLMLRLQTMGRRDHFTPLEMQLALADAQVLFAEEYMSFAMHRRDDLVEWDVENHIATAEKIIDSLEYKALGDGRNYVALHRIDFDNPLLFQNNMHRFALNRIQYSKPVFDGRYHRIMDENGFYKASVSNEQKALKYGFEALRELMGTDKNNLMAQLCAYKDLLSNYDQWRRNEESVPKTLADTTLTEKEKLDATKDLSTLSRVFPLYLEAFTHPFVRQKAEQYHAQKMAQNELTTPLPDNNPAADLIRSLCAKFPGKFLVIDFWGMGCGPCRAAIQSSKQKRAEIAKRDDVKLIFIAGERTTEGSDAYKKYVAEWLADEETVCITHADFRRLEELFKFNGIPHYETITPDCRRVRDDLQVHGFYNIGYEIEQLMEELKK